MFELNSILMLESPFLFVFCGICAIVEGVEEAVEQVRDQVVRRPKAANVATAAPAPAPRNTMCCSQTSRILLSLRHMIAHHSASLEVRLYPWQL